MKVSFNTLGCKINQFYTACVRDAHVKNNDEIIELEENPEIAYINTCAVTKHAGHESRKLYRKARNHAREVQILGCQGKLFPEEFSDATFVDEDKWIEEFENPYQKRTRAYLPVQSGCNNFCTFCIVPYARGKNYSLPVHKVIGNLKHRINSGFKEVIITGVDIGNYKYKGLAIKDLISELLKYEIRIRLSSIKPDIIDNEFIELFSSEFLMPHLHISQQSGDNKILKKMGRNYKREKTIWITDKLRKIRKDIRIAGDFIVGFPGEGDYEFQNTVDLIERAGFTHLHIFRFSKRPQTLASYYPNQIKNSTVSKRSEILHEISVRKRSEFIKSNLGRIYSIIPERRINNNGNLYTGITPNYILVHFNYDKILEEDKIPDVRINKFSNGKVYGEII